VLISILQEVFIFKNCSEKGGGYIIGRGIMVESKCFLCLFFLEIQNILIIISITNKECGVRNVLRECFYFLLNEFL
jgi:hypothetical protein